MIKAFHNFKEELKDKFITLISPIIYVIAFVIIYLIVEYDEWDLISIKCDGGEGQGFGV